MTRHHAYVTADQPGIGGLIKQHTEDFVVEEIPLYDPSDTGRYLYLFIEKRERTTTDAARQIARLFRVGCSDVGFAGLKDKHAVTRQLFSVPITNESTLDRRIRRFKYTPLKLLWAKRHTFKTRRGHLLGNRFTIRIRDVDPAKAETARSLLSTLSATGVPNFVGDQRFGYRQTNHQLGRLLLLGQWEPFIDLLLGRPVASDYATTRAAREAYERGDFQTAIDTWPRHLRHDRQALEAIRQGKSPQDAVMAIDQQQRTFLASAFQSALFNEVLNARIRDGYLGTLLEGDLAWDHDHRTTHPVDADTARLENLPGSRLARLKISPSGPMWGPNMPRAAARVHDWERQVLDETGMSEHDLVGGPQGRAEGTRRPLRCPIRHTRVTSGTDDNGPFIGVQFDLPRGSFATVVLREIMKPDPITNR